MTIKLSYSILNAWSMGRYEDAVAQYLGRPFPTTDAMELGKTMGQLWEQHINATKTLPDELGGGLLDNPICEQKYRKRIPFSDKYEILISGKADCVDGKTIYEFKCGKTEVGTYIGTKQLGYYRLLLPETEIGFYLCYNPYLKTYQKGVRFLTDKYAEDALEHIITYGGEMIDYLQSQKLLIDFDKVSSGKA